MSAENDRRILKRARANRRNERLRAAREIGTHTPEEWAALLVAHDHQCAMCLISANELIGGVLTKDHIRPISEGGSDAIENLQPLCRECNTTKHQRRHA